MPVSPSQHSIARASTAAGVSPLAVAVYWTVTDSLDGAAVTRLLMELAAEEKAQAQRFQFAADRILYITAHAMLRRVLRRHLGGEPSIVSNSLGRPGLAPRCERGPATSFSLTHTRGFAACAVLDNAPVGIDAEDIRRPIEVGAVAARWYAPAEQELLAQLPEQHRLDMFFRIWTLKEAILKATGHGLRIEPQCFAVDPARGCATIPRQLGLPRHWRLAELAPLPDIRMALAIPGEGPLAPSPTRIALG